MTKKPKKTTKKVKKEVKKFKKGVYQGDIQKTFMKAKKQVDSFNKKNNIKGIVVNPKNIDNVFSGIKKELKETYSVILELNNKAYKAQGDTLLEAIRALKVNDFRTEGLLTAYKGELTAQRKFPNIFKLKRLFTNKTLQIIVAKNLELMMK